MAEKPWDEDRRPEWPGNDVPGWPGMPEWPKCAGMAGDVPEWLEASRHV